MSVLCKFLESALDKLQVQAAALGRGPEVLVFSVRQTVGVSAMIQFRQIKNISEGNITSSTFDPGNIDSNRKRSKKCCGFLCENFFRGKKKQTANKMTQLFHIHAWIGGIKILTALDLLLNSCLWFRTILRDPFVDQCMKLWCCVVDTGLFVGFLEMNEKRKSVLGFFFPPHNENLSRTRDLLCYLLPSWTSMSQRNSSLLRRFFSPRDHYRRLKKQ